MQIAGEIPDFDELAWVDAHERKHVSRAVPLALAASTEALAHAGIDAAKLSLEQQREIGVVLGSGGGAQEFSEEQVPAVASRARSKQVSLFCIPSGTHGHAVQRNQHALRLARHEPRHHHRLHVFHRRVRLCAAADPVGYLPMMLVGGVDAPIAPGIMKGFTLMKIMTASWNDEPERASRPFSADRDGFVVAEGSWMFVLEDYEHAQARGARKCSPKSPAMAQPARRFIACVCRKMRRRAGTRDPDGDGRCRGCGA